MRTRGNTSCNHLRVPVMLASCLLWPCGAVAQLQLSIATGSQPVVGVSGPINAVAEVLFADSLTPPVRWFFLTNAPLTTTLQLTNEHMSPTGERYFRAVQIPDTNMVFIPGGQFMMGDALGEGFASELPVHQLSISPFYMARTELKHLEWVTVYAWAAGNGYTFDNGGSVKAPGHPVHTVNWYDAVKWCNARAEMEGRTPVYYTSPEQTNVYRAGRLSLSNECVRWSANGYRLPTEAEWEFAVRSGAAGLRFPWGNTISHSSANYYATANYTYNLSGNSYFHPDYDEGIFPYTSPVGSFAPNAYGVHDLVGNVWEWCWDAYDPAWYGKPEASLDDPRGPGAGFTNRVLRGGSWIDDAFQGRCANRLYTLSQNPVTANDALGFRVVLALPEMLAPATLNNAAVLPNGDFRFTINNLTPGKTNIVETTTDLSGWTAIATNVPTMATMNFTNSPPPSSSGRYYRSRQLP